MSNPEDDWAAFEAAGGADEAEHADDGFGDFGDFGDFPDEEAKEEDKTNVANPPKAEASKSTEQPKDESLDDIDKELQDFMNESDSFSIEKQSKSGKDSCVASSTANDKELEDFINEDSVDNVKMVFTPDGTPEQKEANTQAEPQKKIERFDMEEEKQESQDEDQVKAKAANFEVLHVERQGEALKVRAVEHAVKGVPAAPKEEKAPQQEANVKADEHDDGFGNFDAQEQPKESKEDAFDDNAFGNFEEHNQENDQGEQSDGFGDFGHFENDDSKQHSEAEDGFGDFGHFDDDKPQEEVDNRESTMTVKVKEQQAKNEPDNRESTLTQKVENE